MPLREYHCPHCGNDYVELINHGDRDPDCPHCGEGDGIPLVSVPGAVGTSKHRTPDTNGHGCCGSRPNESGCIPGSCCGRNIR